MYTGLKILKVLELTLKGVLISFSRLGIIRVGVPLICFLWKKPYVIRIGLTASSCYAETSNEVIFDYHSILVLMVGNLAVWWCGFESAGCQLTFPNSLYFLVLGFCLGWVGWIWGWSGPKLLLLAQKSVRLMFYFWIMVFAIMLLSFMKFMCLSATCC